MTNFQNVQIINHRTEFLWKSQEIIDNICRIVTAIKRDYIETTPVKWEKKINTGSLTLITDLENSKLVVCLFVDFDKKLAKKFNLQIHKDPYVVCIDMEILPKFARDLIRDELKKRFRYYMDPRTTNKQVNIMPINFHSYDIIFLEGKCECNEEDQEFIALHDLITRAVKKEKYHTKL